MRIQPRVRGSGMQNFFATRGLKFESARGRCRVVGGLGAGVAEVLVGRDVGGGKGWDIIVLQQGVGRRGEGGWLLW